MSADNKSAFGESTVVHAFDANTVVHVKEATQPKKQEPVKSQPPVQAQAKPVIEKKEERAAAKAKVNASNTLRFRLVVGGIFCALTIVVIFVRREAPKLQAAQPATIETKSTELASQALPIPKSQFSGSVDSNEVLAKFEKASARAQQRASENAR